MEVINTATFAIVSINRAGCTLCIAGGAGAIDDDGIVGWAGSCAASTQQIIVFSAEGAANTGCALEARGLALNTSCIGREIANRWTR